jgi:citrate synthase
LTEESQSTGNGRGPTATGVESLSVVDNRTGESYEVEIEDGTVRAMDFR